MQFIFGDKGEAHYDVTIVYTTMILKSVFVAASIGLDKSRADINMSRSCYGLNKVLDIKLLVPQLTRSMPTV